MNLISPMMLMQVFHRRPFWLLGMACVAVLASVGSVVQAASLAEIATLHRSGASELAFALLDEHQPNPETQAEQWVQWERERVHMYQLDGNWLALIERLRKVPPTLKTPLREWSQTQLAQAYLAEGQGANARRALASLLLDSTLRPPRQRQQQWQRMVIRSYVVDRNYRDASWALEQYQQDYTGGSFSPGQLRPGIQRYQLNYQPKQNHELVELQARIHIDAGLFKRAAVLLRGNQVPRMRLLRLLAELSSGDRKPKGVVAQARKLTRKKKYAKDVRRDAWLLLALAEEQRSNKLAALKALQQAMLLKELDSEGDPSFALDADMLWSAYDLYGRELASKHGLAKAVASEWLRKADSLQKKQPQQAMALLVTVALNAPRQDARAAAHGEFVRIMLKRKVAPVKLVAALYLYAHRFTLAESVPKPVRYVLIEHLLDKPDIRRASRLLASLSQPPQGVSDQEWDLRRARVFVLGGQPEQGAAVLKQLASAGPHNAAQVDRLLQVVFDLQALKRHENALQLFELLLANELPDQNRRELLFWMADSAAALKRHPAAARLYLNSAGLVDPYAMDPWAQTARYKAANQLSKAGLFRDARKVYRVLFNATKDEARKAVIEHEMQQILLLEARQREARRPADQQSF